MTLDLPSRRTITCLLNNHTKLGACPAANPAYYMLDLVLNPIGYSFLNLTFGWARDPGARWRGPMKVESPLLARVYGLGPTGFACCAPSSTASTGPKTRAAQCRGRSGAAASASSGAHAECITPQPAVQQDRPNVLPGSARAP